MSEPRIISEEGPDYDAAMEALLRRAYNILGKAILDARRERDEARKALADYLAAQEATRAYMAAIPDGCRPDPAEVNRLLSAEDRFEKAAREVLR